MNIHHQIVRLLPNLGALHWAIMKANLRDGYRKTAYRLEQLPYCLTSALASLERATARQEELVRSVDVKQHGSNVEIVVSSHERDPIAFDVDAFLEAAVRTQNSLWPYLQFLRNQSLPQSFRSLIEHLNKGTLSFGSAIDSEIIHYWSTSGCRLRAYRDLSQHHIVLPSDARVVITAGDIESFFMPLPSNPEEKRPLGLTYNNESPNAVPYMIEAFLQLVRFLRVVIREILGSDTREPGSIEHAMFKEGAVGWPMRTGAIVTVDALQARLDATIIEFGLESKDTA